MTKVIPIWNLCLSAITLFAQQDTTSTKSESLLSQLEHFSLNGHGAMNYYHFDWQTDTAKRNAIDNERFIFDLDYKWTDKIKLNTEIEIEHGGTGSSVEFDRFEEFGEFEFDISKGGEVLLEQMNLEFILNSKLTLRIGRQKVPFSLMYKYDEPVDYLTNTTSEMEAQIIPTNWTENGMSMYGSYRKWKYHIAIVNGLDGSAFNSSNWIKRGNQRRFEMVNAENFAVCTRLDYYFNDHTHLGLSHYVGNTTDNRPKPDLRVPSVVNLQELHFSSKGRAWQISALAFYGSLSNSEALSNQNRNLSNNLNVKRTPVGSAAIGAFVEIGRTLTGINGLFLKKNKQSSTLYARYDYYDTQYKTQGLIFNNPRWERKSWTIGGVYAILPKVLFKMQYTSRDVGAPAPTSINGGTNESDIVAGFAFEF